MADAPATRSASNIEWLAAKLKMRPLILAWSLLFCCGMLLGVVSCQPSRVGEYIGQAAHQSLMPQVIANGQSNVAFRLYAPPAHLDSRAQGSAAYPQAQQQMTAQDVAAPRRAMPPGPGQGNQARSTSSSGSTDYETYHAQYQKSASPVSRAQAGADNPLPAMDANLNQKNARSHPGEAAVKTTLRVAQATAPHVSSRSEGLAHPLEPPQNQHFTSKSSDIIAGEAIAARTASKMQSAPYTSQVATSGLEQHAASVSAPNTAQQDGTHLQGHTPSHQPYSTESLHVVAESIDGVPKRERQAISSMNDFSNVDKVPIPNRESVVVQDKRPHDHEMGGSPPQNLDQQRPGSLLPDQMIIYARRDEGFASRKRVCRITNICKSESGKILLPMWLSQNREEVRACGLDHVDFVLVDQHYSPGSFTPVEGSNYQLTMSPVPQLGDLLGSKRPRYHMPHFATDVLPSIHALDIVNGDFKTGDIASACRTPNKPCVELPALKPVVAVGYKILSMDPSNWIPRFLSLMGENSIQAAILGDENSSESKHGPSERGMCFRSIVTTSIVTGDLKRGGNFLPHSPFFHKNGISRQPKREEQTPGQRCRVHIVIQQRNSTRRILQSDHIAQAIVAETSRIAAAVDVEVIDFDGTSFDRQLSVSQAADIMIAAHGAGNTNFIFMRPQSAVLEVFPFAYSAGPFDSVAKAVDINYEALTAFPRTQQFHSCLMGYKAEPTLVNELMQRWNEASQEYAARGQQDSLHLESALEHRHGRMCSRNQDLEVDIGRVVGWVMDQVPRQCPAE